MVTGVLDSLLREEAEELIKKYGGKATKSVSRNTSYILAGDDAGPSKLSKVIASLFHFPTVLAVSYRSRAKYVPDRLTSRAILFDF